MLRHWKLTNQHEGVLYGPGSKSDALEIVRRRQKKKSEEAAKKEGKIGRPKKVRRGRPPKKKVANLIAAKAKEIEEKEEKHSTPPSEVGELLGEEPSEFPRGETAFMAYARAYKKEKKKE